MFDFHKSEQWLLKYTVHPAIRPEIRHKIERVLEEQVPEGYKLDGGSTDFVDNESTIYFYEDK